MPTKSPVIRVQIEVKRGHRQTFELTNTQERALNTTTDEGRVSDSIPFATARSMVAKGLLRAQGAEWYITRLGEEVRRRVYAKRRAGR